MDPNKLKDLLTKGGKKGGRFGVGLAAIAAAAFGIQQSFYTGNWLNTTTTVVQVYSCSQKSYATPYISNLWWNAIYLHHNDIILLFDQ